MKEKYNVILFFLNTSWMKYYYSKTVKFKFYIASSVGNYEIISKFNFFYRSIYWRYFYIANIFKEISLTGCGEMHLLYLKNQAIHNCVFFLKLQLPKRKVKKISIKQTKTTKKKQERKEK